MNGQMLRDQIKRDEGTGPMKLGRFYPYQDTVGKITIGYGWNLTDNGIPSFIAERLLDFAINETVSDLLKKFPWAAELDAVRFGVLLNMAYNLGVPRLAQFTRTLALVQAKDYAAAADAMMQSKWAGQVKGRALRLAMQMRTGEWQ